MSLRSLARLVPSATVLLLAANIASCVGDSEDSSQATEPIVVRVGVLATMAGALQATSGRPTMSAALLAVRQLEEAGGLDLGGRMHRIELVVEDDGNDPERAVAAARKLIQEDGVAVIIGPQVSRNAIPVAALAEEAGIPMISPMSSHPETTRGRRNVFRLAVVDDVLGSIMGELAARDLGARRAGILFNADNPYSRSMSDIFSRTFSEAGGEVVALEEYSGDRVRDFRAELNRIRDAAPEVLFLPNLAPEVPTQAREAREAGIDAILLGADTWDVQAFAPDSIFEGAYFTHQWHAGEVNSEGEAFMRAYQAAYNATPLNTAAATYDAFQLLFEIMRAEGSAESSAIRTGLSRPRRFTGVTGDLEFVGTGDPQKRVPILRFSGGGVEILRTVRR